MCEDFDDGGYSESRGNHNVLKNRTSSKFLPLSWTFHSTFTSHWFDSQWCTLGIYGWEVNRRSQCSPRMNQGYSKKQIHKSTEQTVSLPGGFYRSQLDDDHGHDDHHPHIMIMRASWSCITITIMMRVWWSVSVHWDNHVCIMIMCHHDHSSDHH